MLKLWKNCDVYAPAHLGRRDILMEGGVIAAVEPDLSRWESAPEIEIRDLAGAVVCPGLIDLHVHVTGGGGEQGPASRTPELQLTDFTRNGVTSVLGLLGTDGVTRSLENLLAKCRALEAEGLSTWMLTGSYRFPSGNLMGDVQRDVALIDKVVGVKVAMSDHRSSMITGQELARLGAEARVGGMLGGKPGIVTIHMGDSPRRMENLFWALENADVPPAHFLPTHCGRTPELMAHAVRFNRMGGTVDITARSPESETGAAAVLAEALRQGADPGGITMSSDAGGSQPVFNEAGECIGLGVGTSATLLPELRRLVQREKLPLETALRFFTENPARVLGQTGKKGAVAPGADADLLVPDGDFRVRQLLLRGKDAILDGKPVLFGRFEH